MRTQQQPGAMRLEPVAQQPITAITQPMIGPEPGGIRSCLLCKAEFGQEEPWLQISRQGAGYSVGAHPACLARRQQPQRVTA